MEKQGDKTIIFPGGTQAIELHNTAGLINQLHLRIIALEQKLDKMRIEYRLTDLEQKIFSETEKRLKKLEKTSNLHQAAIIKQSKKMPADQEDFPT